MGERLWVSAWCLSEKTRGGRGIEYKQPRIFGSRRGDQDRTSQTVFIKMPKCIYTRSKNVDTQEVGEQGRANVVARKFRGKSLKEEVRVIATPGL